MNARATVMVVVILAAAGGIAWSLLQGDAFAWPNGGGEVPVDVDPGRVADEGSDLSETSGRGDVSAESGDFAEPGGRVSVEGPGAMPRGSVSGYLALQHRYDVFSACLDGERVVDVDLTNGTFKIEQVSAGPHRITAVGSTGVAVDVLSRTFEMEAAQELDLGKVVQQGSAQGIVKVLPFHGRSGAAFSDPELTKSGLGRRRADLLLDGNLFFAPIAADVAVRGLPTEGLAVVVRGAPPTVRMDTDTLSLRREYEPAILQPNTRCVLPLDFVQQAPVLVHAFWTEDLGAAAHIDVVDVQWDSVKSTKCPGKGSATSRVITSIGQQVVLVTAVDGDGAIAGFGVEAVDLPKTGAQVSVQLTHVWPAVGKIDEAEAWVTLRPALCPQHVIWQAETDRLGNFALPWVPADVALVAVVGDGEPRGVRPTVRGQQIELEIQ